MASLSTPLNDPCKACGSSVNRRSRMRTEYCSEECRADHKRKLRRNPPKPICERCTKGFVRNSGRQKFCLECKPDARRAYNAQYFRVNAEIIRPTKRAEAADRRKREPEKVRDQDRAWRFKHRERLLAALRTPEENAKAAARQRARSARDVRVVINNRMHTGIAQSLRGMKRGRKWESIAGYGVDALMAHLERQFLPGMTWANRAKWHIDHIVPLCSFAFEDADCPAFKAAWALTNLRPLWKRANLQKGGRRIHLI